MPKIATYADVLATRARTKAQQTSNFDEGTEICITCSQSRSGNRSFRNNLIKLDNDQRSHNNVGFTLKVTIIVKRRSSTRTSSGCILDHRTDINFWIPYDFIMSDIDVSGFLSKLMLFMNVPFTFDDHNLKWKGIRYMDGERHETNTAVLENKDILISKIVELARTMEEDRPSSITPEKWHMALDITKVTYLPQVEFMEMSKNMNNDCYYMTWKRSQEELDSRIAALEALHNYVEIKKMRFEAGATVDMCSICREEFLEGSMVSCISSCSHVYHEACLLEWLLTSRSCPYCRYELTK